MMPSDRHILIVNSRSVHQPVFVVGAPHSGADLIGRALKASAGFHVTIGQPSVLRTVYAFARRPSMHQGRTQAAATVIRDAFSQGWQVTSHSCLECTRECRAAAGLAADAVGPCVDLRGLQTFGDASPDLIYCAEALTYAFRDARIVQVVRAGRGALRWRWSVRLAARLHHSLPSGRLKTIRYEHLMSKPDEALADLSRFAGTTVQAAEIRNEARTARARSRRAPAYEMSLTTEDIT